MNGRLLAAGALLLALAVSSRAQPDPARPEAEQAAWESLSPERRAAVLRNYARYRALPSEERQRIQERFARFQKLPPERKQALREREQWFQSLPPRRQEQLKRGGAVPAAPKRVPDAGRKADAPARELLPQKTASAAPAPTTQADAAAKAATEKAAEARAAETRAREVERRGESAAPREHIDRPPR